MTDVKQGSGQAYKGVPAAERRALRRARLIEAAIEVYGQTGFRGASVKGVCEAAGLTERYFYESFPGGQALLVAAYEHVADQLSQRLAEAAATVASPGHERAAALLHAYCLALRENPSSARLFLVEISGAGADVDAAFEDSLDGLADLIEEAWGDTAGVHDSALRVGVAGGLVRILKHWVASGYARPDGEIVAAGLCLTALLAPVGR
ncbi:TetR/AcrR family transcriptional regulator [Sphingopyxis sp. BSN-002]|uniref:TetR/AcrR family transcriptional regulator n=1 Tax=Sphingopyxis sp. BSN-002 TaxID=2911495 RepID=UPI001EDA6D02|nr:TetR family transcriptional regulator [Sphingopyxis sp. BSN-002]UKK84074.1 TetR/AcrR family transcriptional regulator [Sphingopyxis sp. BSN-002]